MDTFSFSYWQRMSMAVLVWVATLVAAEPAHAVTPEDPGVKKLVERALKYLEDKSDTRLGGQCLIGLCFKKANIEDHPKIKEAVDACYKANIKERKEGGGGCDNYSLGIALMFLCEAEAIQPNKQHKHHDLIVRYLDELLARQMGNGAWSYENFQNGDVSQTQYGVLGMWMAKNHAKVDIPVDRMEAACGWLMRTQDVGGGWPYQPVDPGTFNRIQQDAGFNGITRCRSAAAAGSLYIMADMLQITPREGEPNVAKAKALQDIEVPGRKKEIRGPLTRTLKPGDIKSSLALADRNLGTGYTTEQQWNHYYMYALERYHSFREIAGGGKENKWYDQGYDHLSKTQKGDGGWESSEFPHISTCFAVLFLLRSAKKSIDKKLSEGVALGGSGLPNDVRDLVVNEKGKVMNAGIVIPTDTLLELIQAGPSDAVTRKAEEKEALDLSKNPTDRNRQIEKLRKTVSDGKFEARMVAVVTLSKNRDLKNVPLLLYALTDPDPEIVREADKGLRIISRKVNGVGLPEGDLTMAQIKAAQAAWKAWYLSIRPDAELLD
ncbi:MAG: hypothetical protein ACKVP0_21995 [Pirellulaceae bacterium]